jgi:ABC-type transport system involved in cytochrome bd biosynthesis fused ATPase/permease subunit
LDRYTKDVAVTDASDFHENDLGVAQASFSWYKETDDITTQSRMSFRLRIEDEIMFRQGALNLIVGPTGSGKTSLLQALLGEMHYLPSGPGAWVNVPRRRGVAYCAQVSTCS